MITMQNVRKTYGNFTFEISMELPEGQILGLIGKNGAGKSTAIKLILGLCRAEEGTVTVLGSDSKELSEKVKQDIGVSLAESGFSGELTVSELEDLRSYLTGQASDGWGEGLEQHGVKTADFGEIYVSFWNDSNDWSLQTEEEMGLSQAEKHTEEPSMGMTL